MSTANSQNDPPGHDHRRSVDSAAGQEVLLPPRDHSAIRTNSPYRYHHQDIFVTSTDEVEGSQQSPPTYHRIPTSSQVALDSRSFTDLETPPYRSRINLSERDEKLANIPMSEDKVVDEKAPLRGVHYPSNLDSPPVHRPAIIRVDSDAPSAAGTDEEYEEDSEYDWSGEEDLVDEEAKFEEQMGKKPKRKGWGPKRYAYIDAQLYFFSRLTSVLRQDYHPSLFLAHRLHVPRWFAHHCSDPPPLLLVQEGSYREPTLYSQQCRSLAILGRC